MVIYKLTRKNTFVHFAPSHFMTVSGQGSSFCEVPIKKSINDFRVPMQSFVWLILTLILLERDLKANKKMKQFPSIQCESHVSELRVPLRAS